MPSKDRGIQQIQKEIDTYMKRKQRSESQIAKGVAPVVENVLLVDIAYYESEIKRLNQALDSLQ